MLLVRKLLNLLIFSKVWGIQGFQELNNRTINRVTVFGKNGRVYALNRTEEVNIKLRHGFADYKCS